MLWLRVQVGPLFRSLKEQTRMFTDLLPFVIQINFKAELFN